MIVVVSIVVNFITVLGFIIINCEFILLICFEFYLDVETTGRSTKNKHLK